ncbi:MAG: hypothetical protein KBS86_00450 [Proteobacteria bacterium]|nr:hypothetical protein [Candidatus Enterousia scatequi]
MKKTCIITTIMTVCGAAYGDIASTDYVDNGANGKQGLLTAGSGVIIIDDVISTTNTTPYETGTSTKPGIIKLYNNTGTGVDGGMTQNALTTALNNKQDTLPHAPTNGKYDVVWDGTTGGFRLEFQKYSLTCPSGQYDFGMESCINSSTNGSVYGYINPTGSESTNSGPKVVPSTYGLTENGTWGATFSWGVVTGEATCLSEAEGLGRTSGYSPYGTGEYSNTFIDASKGLSGKDADGADCIYCWCNMQSPAVSRWVLDHGHASSSNCAGSCADGCGNRVQAVSSFRSAVFSSFGN